MFQGFIKTTDHRPTDHRSSNPPTTYYLPTVPPTTYSMTHRFWIDFYHVFHSIIHTNSVFHSKHTRFFFKQHTFSTQYCLTFQLIEPEMLFMSCLLHIDIILPRNVMFSLRVGLFMSYLCLIYVTCFSLIFSLLLQ